MMNTLQTVVKLILFAFILSACTTTSTPAKVVLLAPFEGEYRDIGYSTLYAVRLAIADANIGNIDLLALDDGQSAEAIQQRAEAILQDETIEFVIVISPYASIVTETLHEYRMIVVEHWDNVVLNESQVALMPSDMPNNSLTTIQSLDVWHSNSDAQSKDIVSVSTLPDADFATRYLESDIFVPEATLYTTLAYDAMRIGLQALEMNVDLRDVAYNGLNGDITFDDDGFWANAPINLYRIDDGELIEIPSRQ